MISPCAPRTPGARFSRRRALAAAAVMATVLAGRHPIAAFAGTQGATSEVDRLTGLIETGAGDRGGPAGGRGGARPGYMGGPPNGRDG